MYFYVDESGQTGKNLFDENQPVLYYGVISSEVDLDITLTPYIEKARRELGVERLHAAELGNGGLVRIAEKLRTIQRKNKFHFDFFTIRKPDHALICFFDQVFDQGLNKAVPWTSYWTPLRYALIWHLANLFDLPLLKMAWEVRNTVNCEKANLGLQNICKTLLGRAETLKDARAKEIITDALKWAILHPAEIHYNIYHRNDADQISPNLIAFQSALHGIANRLKNKDADAVSIIVDRQSQFNKAQKSLADLYRQGRGELFPAGPGLPTMDLTHTPNVPITCTPGTDSVGLELVDIYLWLIKRLVEEKPIAPELRALIEERMHDIYHDEVSLEALMNRWGAYFRNLPPISDKEMDAGRALLAEQEQRRRQHIQP